MSLGGALAPPRCEERSLRRSSLPSPGAERRLRRMHADALHKPPGSQRLAGDYRDRMRKSSIGAIITPAILRPWMKRKEAQNRNTHLPPRIRFLTIDLSL